MFEALEILKNVELDIPDRAIVGKFIIQEVPDELLARYRYSDTLSFTYKDDMEKIKGSFNDFSNNHGTLKPMIVNEYQIKKIIDKFKPQPDISKSVNINGNTPVSLNYHGADGIRSQLPKESDPEAIITNPFPIEVFPKFIQDYIIKVHETLGFNIDYLGASILYLTAVCVGNSYKLQIKPGYCESAVLFIALVGRPGLNKKSPALSHILRPIFEYENMQRSSYDQTKQEYDNARNLNKKDNQEMGSALQEKPVLKHYLVNDHTPESLILAHKNNPKGLGLYYDELIAWIKDFQKYHKGSDEQFWLSAWNGSPVFVNRKSLDHLHLPKPNISVIGTIQPSLLLDLLREYRNANGFIDRILFAFPEVEKAEYFNEKGLPASYSNGFSEFAKRLIDIPEPKIEDGVLSCKYLEYSDKAYQLFLDWDRKHVDHKNNCKVDKERELLSKLDAYIHRLALVLEIVHWANSNSKGLEVSENSINGAIALIKYFHNTAMKVQSTINTVPSDDKFEVKVCRLLKTKGYSLRQTGEILSMSHENVRRLLNEK